MCWGIYEAVAWKFMGVRASNRWCHEKYRKLWILIGCSLRWEFFAWLESCELHPCGGKWFKCKEYYWILTRIRHWIQKFNGDFLPLGFHLASCVMLCVMLFDGFSYVYFLRCSHGHVLRKFSYMIVVMLCATYILWFYSKNWWSNYCVGKGQKWYKLMIGHNTNPPPLTVFLNSPTIDIKVGLLASS